MRCASASCSATAHSVLPDENCGIGLTSPARLVLAGGVSLRLDRSTRAPLLRFVSLQRSLANRALSGSAILRTIPLRHWLASCDGGDRSCPRRNGRLPLRFFALRMRRSPETVFKHARSVAGHASRLSSRDVPLPALFGTSVTWPGRSSTRRRSWDSFPSQYCSCSRVSKCFHCSRPPAVS